MSEGTTRVRGWERPVAIPADLRELGGVLDGVVHLPLGVYSSGEGPERGFDLTNDAERRGLYEVVLTDGRVQDVCRYLNLDELRRLWPTLFLPAHVRRAWEPRLAEQARR